MHSSELVHRLTRELGLGDMPMVRLRLYGRLGRACEADPTVLAVVRAVALESKGKRNPGKWFSAAIGRRLEECGLADRAGVQDLVSGLAAGFQEGGVP
jgi:hypothetical protein